MSKTSIPSDHSADEISMHFGRLLKFWRSVFKMSQEELASRIDSASRHISRLEKGDAHPSREMVSRIAEALSLGSRDTVNLLFSAGYINLSQNLDISAPEFAYRKKEVGLGLKAIEPNPALVIDITGNMLMMNRACAGLLRKLDPEDEFGDSPNVFDVLCSSSAIRSQPQEFEGTLSAMMLSLQQSLFFCDAENEKITALFERLEASPYVPRDWQKQAITRQAGGEFKVNIMIDGTVREFLIHSYIENLLGPLAFSARPDMIVMTFCSEDESFDVSSLLMPGVDNPLLID